MNNQLRLEVQGAVQQWVASFVQQYNVPAAIMEDALNKALLMIKDQVMIEYISAENASKEEIKDGENTESGDSA